MNDTLAAAAPRADWLTPLELLALGAIWGGSFLFMRIAAPSFGPFALVEVRIVLGALILLPFLWQVRARLDAKRVAQFAIVGALNSAIPFSLFAWGAERAPAGIGAIANSLTVLFTALVALLVYRERIGRRRALAMLVGFVGVVVLMMPVSAVGVAPRRKGPAGSSVSDAAERRSRTSRRMARARSRIRMVTVSEPAG